MTKGFIKGMLVGAGTALLALTAGILISGCALSTSPSGRALKEYVEQSEKIANLLESPVPEVTPGPAVLISDQNGDSSVQKQDGDNSTDDGTSVSVSSKELPISAYSVSKLELLEYYIEHYYYFDYSTEAVQEKLFEAMVEGLGDPYSTYYSPEEYTVLNGDNNGEFGGIGATFSQNSISLIMTVESVNADSPAQKAGIMKGDVLVGVNGESVIGKSLNETISKVRGEYDTSVLLRFFRPTDESGEGVYLDFEVVRERIEIITTTSSMISSDGVDYGYIKITSFDGKTYDQFTKAVEDLTAQGAKGLIIDLRGNGGGLFLSAIEMADYILEDGLLITYTDSRLIKDECYYSDDGHKVELPIVILVDGNSASSSEVFTGALKDHRVACVCGTKSFGKGIVQSVWSLGDGSAIKLTTASYYTPSGVCIHKTGIEPNLQTENDPLTEEDEVIEDALLILPIMIEEGMEGLE